jgi:NUDIX domain
MAGGFPSQPCQDSANPRGKTCGNLEANESLLHGAVREADEELGIVINPDALSFGTMTHFFFQGSGSVSAGTPSLE